MKMIIPIVLLLVGLAFGIGGAYFLRPDQSLANTSDQTAEALALETGDHGPHAEPKAHGEEQSHEAPTHETDDHGGSHDEHGSGDEGYYEIQNQFVIPVIHQGSMKSIVLMGLAIETDASSRSELIRKEPKLRDAFLRVMLDHATIGGFDGNFLQNGPMDLLEANLLAKAKQVVGPGISDVLLLEVGRQEFDTGS